MRMASMRIGTTRLSGSSSPSRSRSLAKAFRLADDGSDIASARPMHHAILPESARIAGPAPAAKLYTARIEFIWAQIVIRLQASRVARCAELMSASVMGPCVKLSRSVLPLVTCFCPWSAKELPHHTVRVFPVSTYGPDLRL